MKNCATAAALVTALLISSVANAGFYDGNGLHELCESKPAYALGYVMGAADFIDLEMGAVDSATGQMVVPKKFICVPAGAIGQQMSDIACKYLEDHPEVREKPAAVLVYTALLNAWRCKE